MTIPKMFRGFKIADHPLRGKTVQIKGLPGHEGIVFGRDVLGSVLIGLTKSKIVGYETPKPGRQYISVFHTSDKKLVVI